MNIKTNSIIDLLEITLNKKIEDIKLEDLKEITYLRVNKINNDDILNVDSKDLLLFSNLKELSIDNCMIDDNFLNDLEKVATLEKISFICCDFVDECKDYFNNLSLDELVLNDVIGLDDIEVSNIKKITIINCFFNINIKRVNTLDISRSINTKIDFNNIDLDELIVSKLEQIDSNLKCKIIVKDNYDEVVKVINND